MYVKKPFIGDFKVTSPFGMRIHPISKSEKMHNGIDIGMPIGTKLYAPLAGNLITAEDDRAGKFMQLYCTTEQGNKVTFIFCHLSKFIAEEGPVKEWQEIAVSGNSGTSTGPHLHLGLKINGEFVNPLKYINFA